MKSINYPAFETHKRSHDQFRKVMFTALAKIESGEEKDFRSALSLAWGWLYSHIVKVDKKYGEFYRGLVQD